jgi:hypothetical protein
VASSVTSSAVAGPDADGDAVMDASGVGAAAVVGVTVGSGPALGDGDKPAADRVEETPGSEPEHPTSAIANARHTATRRSAR